MASGMVAAVVEEVFTQQMCIADGLQVEHHQKDRRGERRQPDGRVVARRVGRDGSEGLATRGRGRRR